MTIMREIINKYKYPILAIIIIILFLSVKSYVNKHQLILQGENKVLKEQVQTLKDGVEISEQNRRREKDSITKVFDKKQKEIEDLSKKVLQSEKKIAYLTNKNIKNKERIAKLTHKESAKEFNDIYNTNNAKATYTGVELQKDLPNLVLETISDANYCQEVVAEKDNQIEAKNEQLKLKDEQIEEQSILLNSAEKEIEQRKLLENAQNNLIDTQQKENNKLKTNKWLDNYILKPLIFVGGVYLGTQIVK